MEQTEMIHHKKQKGQPGISGNKAKNGEKKNVQIIQKNIVSLMEVWMFGMDRRIKFMR